GDLLLRVRHAGLRFVHPLPHFVVGLRAARAQALLLRHSGLESFGRRHCFCSLVPRRLTRPEIVPGRAPVDMDVLAGSMPEGRARVRAVAAARGRGERSLLRRSGCRKRRRSGVRSAEEPPKVRRPDQEEYAMAAYVLPDLEYDFGALEPHITGQIMELHHNGHHKAYVEKANLTLEQLAEARDKQDFSKIAPLEKALAFNLSGHVLHSIFWKNLAPRAGGTPTGALARAIDR